VLPSDNITHYIHISLGVRLINPFFESRRQSYDAHADKVRVLLKRENEPAGFVLLLAATVVRDSTCDRAN
jgi:hypothetical protein